ncbi:MAG: ferric uptake regulator family protein [Marmoricola sp.]|nr:ferric uptake regulator family protein [Marmoricola sp.]
MASKRDAVLEALTAEADFLSAQDLHANLRASGEKIGLATVYRSLQAMQESGEVDTLRSEGGEVTYRRCASTGHHHHLVCRICGRTVEVEGPAVEKWAATTAAEHGYTDVSHTVEIFGVCGDH